VTNQSTNRNEIPSPFKIVISLLSSRLSEKYLVIGIINNACLLLILLQDLIVIFTLFPSVPCTVLDTGGGHSVLTSSLQILESIDMLGALAVLGALGVVPLELAARISLRLIRKMILQWISDF
jgi:hypothetical protein